MGVGGSGDHPSDTLGRSRDAGLRGLREDDQLLRLASLPLYSHLDGFGAEKLREVYFPSLSLNSSSANRLLDEIWAFQTMLHVRIIWGKFEKNKRRTQLHPKPIQNLWVGPRHQHFSDSPGDSHVQAGLRPRPKGPSSSEVGCYLLQLCDLRDGIESLRASCPQQ